MAEFKRVTEHIQRLEVSWRSLGLFRVPVTVWLIQVGEDFLLVDAGPPRAADQVVAAVARATAGRGPRLLLLTHGHADHSGGLSALRQAWNPPLVCHVDEVPFITGQLTYRDVQTEDLLAWIGRFFVTGPPAAFPVSLDLERGQAVEEMAVIHLPGHTPGHVGFLHPSDSALLCGDALVNLGGHLSVPTAFATPQPELAYRSIERLADLDFAHLLPSHGPAILHRGRQAVLEMLGRLGELDTRPL